ncbi:MAG TPA: hypothetical protein VG711_01525, partial [Phycisphaerales bacterium]|nr:hypothetical protein [Phycisphaerales bacterium]
QILNIEMSDQRQCWDMQSDGTYKMRQPMGSAEDSNEAMGTHQAMMNLVVQAHRDAERPDGE